MNMPSGTAPERPDNEAQSGGGDAPAASAQVRPTPAPPTQSREDTDIGWGDYRERDDDDWLLRDRPPHWDNT
jgi:hypothetical protein